MFNKAKMHKFFALMLFCPYALVLLCSKAALCLLKLAEGISFQFEEPGQDFICDPKGSAVPGILWEGQLVRN